MTALAWDDDGYIDACIAGGDTFVRSQCTAASLTPCRWCGHLEHGLPCKNLDGCKCDSSHTSRDDSWRPRLLGDHEITEAWRLMDRYGIDGFVATRAAAPTMGLAHQIATFKLRRQLAEAAA